MCVFNMVSRNMFVYTDYTPKYNMLDMDYDLLISKQENVSGIGT